MRSPKPMQRNVLIPALLASWCFACGEKTEDATGPMEDFPTVPQKLEASTIEYSLVEYRIPAGKDIQVCHYLETTTEDMFIKAFDSYQGKLGHHLILFSAVVTEDPGTVRDCSSAEDMVKFRPVVSN